MSARFELDETRAAAWLAAQMAAYDAWLAGTTATGCTALEVGTGYDPCHDYEGYDTTSLVWQAREAGCITGPGTVDYDHCAGEGETGYVWLVYLDGPGSLKLSSYYEKIKHLGDGSDPGVPAALGVLREAVAEANHLLDGLDAYIAAKAAPQPA